ncbi:hypothetical protein HUJ04_000477 [Dendroctonus ponderosae]|nr:hypothetical protein HUJ04_000477 [Dendroctonus ponderosae]
MNDASVRGYGAEQTTENNTLTTAHGFIEYKDNHKYTWTQTIRQLKSIIDYVTTLQQTQLQVKDLRNPEPSDELTAKKAKTTRKTEKELERRYQQGTERQRA